MKTLYTLLCALFPVFAAYSQCTVTLNQTEFNVNCGDSVHVVASGNSVLASDNFQAGLLGSMWDTHSVLTYGNTVCEPTPDNGFYIWFSSGYPRHVTTNPLNVINGGYLEFDLRMGIQGDAQPCEGPDNMTEGIHVQYSVDGGSTWVDMEYYEPFPAGNFNALYNGAGNYTAWHTYTLPIPPAAISYNTRFRWQQDLASLGDFDTWGLDDVTIYENYPGNYDWGNGYSAANDTLFFPTTTGSQTVSFNVGSNYCSATFDIHVATPSMRAYSSDTLVCDSSTITLGVFADSVSLDYGTISWNPASAVNNPIAPITTALPSGTATYTATFTHNTLAQCNTSDSVTVETVPGFQMDATIPYHTFCLNQDVQFNAITSTNDSYTYIWNATGNHTNELEPSSNIANPYIDNFMPNGQYSYAVTVTSPSGCTRTDTVSFTVIQAFAPDISISGLTSMMLGDSVLLTINENSGDPDVLFSWAPQQYFSSPNQAASYAYPPSTMMLYGTGKDSVTFCKTTDSVLVTVSTTNITTLQENPLHIYPNPSNGTLTLESSVIEKAQLQLYDIQGRKVFEKAVPSLQKNTITLPPLPAGMYTLKVTTENAVHQHTIQLYR